MLWQELTKIALLGTAQAGMSAELKKELEQQGLDTDVPEETLVLEAAALYGQLRKATLPIQQCSDVSSTPAPMENGQVISAEAAQHLRKILDGTFAPALSEFFYFLRKQDKQLPPELLPALLDACLENPEFWQQIAPFLGERGRWLMTQHPPWKALLKRKSTTEQASWQPDEAQSKQVLHYLHTLKRILSGSNAPYYPSQEDRQKLRYAAYEVNPDYYERIADDWRLDYRSSAAWQSDIERMLRTVAFRESMRKALLA